MSYLRPSWSLPTFLEDLLSEATGSYAIWAQMLFTPLDFLRYHDFFTSLGQAFLIPHFLGPKTYFLLLMGQALLFHFQGPSLLPFLIFVGWIFLAFTGLASFYILDLNREEDSIGYTELRLGRLPNDTF